MDPDPYFGDLWLILSFYYRSESRRQNEMSFTSDLDLCYRSNGAGTTSLIYYLPTLVRVSRRMVIHPSTSARSYRYT